MIDSDSNRNRAKEVNVRRQLLTLPFTKLAHDAETPSKSG